MIPVDNLLRNGLRIEAVVNAHGESVSARGNAVYNNIKLAESAVVRADESAVKIHLRLGHDRAEEESESAALGVEVALIPAHALVVEKSHLCIPAGGDNHGLCIGDGAIPALRIAHARLVGRKTPRAVERIDASYVMLGEKSHRK